MKRRTLTSLLFVFIAATAVAQTSKIVSTDWLQNHLNDRSVVVVEIGDRAAFEESHIAGARFVALTDIAVTRGGVPNELPDFDRLAKVMSTAGVPDRGRIILYSRDLIAAARGYFTLDALGCAFDAAILDGGFAKWSAEKRPVQSGPAPAQTTSFAPCPHPEIVVNTGAMRMLVNSAPSPLSIVDARPAAQYLGKEAGADVVKPGHIPGAINIAWNENLTSSVTPQFRSLEDLRALYKNAGVADRGPVVVYCRTGMQASVDYFILRALDREVYLYDAGYIQWNNADGTQVEKPSN